MSSWVNNVVRCPIHHVHHAAANVTNATSLQSRLGLIQAVLPHWADVLAATEVELGSNNALGGSSSSSSSSSSSGVSGSSDGSSGDVADDWFPYASTTLLFALVAAQALIFAALTWWRYHGFFVYANPKRASTGSHPSSPLTPGDRSNVKRYGSMFQNNESIVDGLERNLSTALNARSPLDSDATISSLRRVRIVTKSTSNLMWILYYISIVLVKAVAAGTLVFAANFSARDHQEALRIAWLFQRLLHGISCVWLAIALNVQRLYRAKDHKNAKANQLLLRQATWMNRFCFGSFALFSLGDFIASHTVSAVSDATTILYWISIASLILLAVPSLISIVWVLLNESAMQPSTTAKSFLAIGVVFHLIVQMPPDFWNEYVLKTFVHEHPCPLIVMSFYDILLCLHFVSTGLIFAFMVLEHRRTSTIANREYLAFCEDRLYRRMIKDGTLQAPSNNGTQLSSLKGAPSNKPPVGRKARVVSVLAPSEKSMSTVNTPGRESDRDIIVSTLPDVDDEQGGLLDDEEDDARDFANLDAADDDLGEIRAY